MRSLLGTLAAFLARIGSFSEGRIGGLRVRIPSQRKTGFDCEWRDCLERGVLSLLLGFEDGPHIEAGWSLKMSAEARFDAFGQSPSQSQKGHLVSGRRLGHAAAAEAARSPSACLAFASSSLRTPGWAASAVSSQPPAARIRAAHERSRPGHSLAGCS